MCTKQHQLTPALTPTLIPTLAPTLTLTQVRRKSKEFMERIASAAHGGPAVAGLASSFGFAPLTGASAVSAAEEGRVDRSGLADTHTRATARLARESSNPHPHPHPHLSPFTFHPHPSPHPSPHPPTTTPQ